MCRFFSAVATRDERLLFCETDSHEDIVSRAGLRDVDLYLRHFVRLELVTSQLVVDETSIPAWFDKTVWYPRVESLKNRVSGAKAAYDTALAKAEAAHDAALAPARAAYGAARVTAGAAYDAALVTTGAAYDTALAKARVAYLTAIAPARAAYDAARVTARVACDAARVTAGAAYMRAIQPFEGYIGA